MKRHLADIFPGFASRFYITRMLTSGMDDGEPEPDSCEWRSSTSVFRANPFTVNDGPFETVSETTVDGHHGPLMYPPIILEFSRWDDPGSAASSCFPVTPKTPFLADPPASRTPRKPRKRRRSGHSPPLLLSASSSSSFQLSAPATPPLTPWSTHGPLFTFGSPSTFPFLPDRRPSISSTASLAPIPAFDSLGLGCRIYADFWLPPSLSGRKNAVTLRSSPPFGDFESSRGDLILPPPLPTLFLGFLAHLGSNQNHDQNEQDSEWSYHPSGWRGLPGPKLLPPV